MNVEARDKMLTVGAGSVLAFGLAVGLINVAVPALIIGAVVTGMVWFANVNKKDLQEKGKLPIDADEIISPTRPKRQTVKMDGEVIDLSMEDERQLWRTEAEIAKLEKKLAQKRSAQRTLKRSAE